MSDGHNLIREAVAALRARGHNVEPWTGSLPYRLVDGETLTDGDPLALSMSLRPPPSSQRELAIIARELAI